MQTARLDLLACLQEHWLELGGSTSGIMRAGLSSSVPKFCGPSGLSGISATATTTRCALAA